MIEEPSLNFGQEEAELVSLKKLPSRLLIYGAYALISILFFYLLKQFRVDISVYVDSFYLLFIGWALFSLTKGSLIFPTKKLKAAGLGFLVFLLGLLLLNLFFAPMKIVNFDPPILEAGFLATYFLAIILLSESILFFFFLKK